MKYLIRATILGIVSLCVLPSCEQKESRPDQPDFITVYLDSADDVFILEKGESFEMAVAAVANADSYEWNIPNSLGVNSGQNEARISVYAKEEGVIESGFISVMAVNSAGISYPRTLWKSIRVKGLPPRLSFVQMNVKGSRTVEKGQEIVFDAEWMADCQYEWSVPLTMQIVSGGDTNAVTVKITGESELIPDKAVSVKITEGGSVSTHYFEKPLYVLPLVYEGVEYKTKRYRDKVWMVENLRYTGTGGDMGLPPNNTPGLVETQGLLYTWFEAMTGVKDAQLADAPYAFGDTGIDDEGNEYTIDNTVGQHNIQIRGICPEGWHVPNAFDRYDLVYGIADDYDLLVNSVNYSGGIIKRLDRNTYEGPVAAFEVATHGLVTAYLKGSAPNTETGGLWNATGMAQNGWYNAGNTYPLFLDLRTAIGFNLLPSGKVNAASAYENYGNYSFHWTTALDSSGNAMRMTAGYNNANFSRTFEGRTQYMSIRCVADYTGDPYNIE